eukprot:gene15660-4526_t
MVEINVGGRVFATSRATLCRSPVLALLFAAVAGQLTAHTAWS